MNLCPECLKSLSEKAKRCSCGWISLELPQSFITNQRCNFTAANRFCRLPGTMSPHRGKWYCRRHYHTLGDLKLAEAELNYIEKNFQKIMDEEYQDWRRLLVTL